MEILNSTSLLNAYFIFESLEDDKTTIKIGKLINEHVDGKSSFLYYNKIRNREYLISGLRKISDAENIYPLIHIAAHGKEDGTGVRLLEDTIEWDELTKEIYEINVRAKNNVILVMALCKGARIMGSFYKAQRAPFYTLMGPVDNINWNVLDDRLYKFYEILLKSKSLHDSLRELKEYHGGTLPFYYFNCVGGYQKIIQQTKQKLESGQSRHEMLESYKRQTGKKADYDVKSGFMYKEQQEPYLEQALKIHKDHWFMIDLYPENKMRFENLDTKLTKDNMR